MKVIANRASGDLVAAILSKMDVELARKLGTYALTSRAVLNCDQSGDRTREGGLRRELRGTNYRSAPLCDECDVAVDRTGRSQTLNQSVAYVKHTSLH